jgi:tRNA(Ile)-lysidine synthase
MFLQDRVKSLIRENSLVTAGDKVVVAVSGGPDSLCLLHFLHQLSQEIELRLVVAHLNHGLRPEAQLEADGVKEIASVWSLPFEVKTVDINNLKKRLKLSEEEAGRRARYRFLFQVARKYSAGVIALGHHFDDQAETVLLNIIRGCSVDGLAGMQPVKTRGRIKLIRPLLCLRRAEIENYCRQHNLHPFTDSSNLETDYTRNKLRLQLMPHLENTYNPKIKEALVKLASLAAADRKYLKAMAGLYFFKLTRSSGVQTIIELDGLLKLPLALRSRLLRMAIRKHLKSKEFGKKHIDQLLSICKTGRPGSEISLPGQIRAYIRPGKLILGVHHLAVPVMLDSKALNIPGKTRLTNTASIEAVILRKENVPWPPPKYRACLDYEKLADRKLQVRTRLPGDLFFPQGAPGKKKLKDFLIDQKTPAYVRDTIPLIVCEGEIIWVAGLRIANPYRITETTERVLCLDYRIQIVKGGINIDSDQ